MEEMELKTSLKQRIAIIVIAVLMLGSVIAGYVAIVASRGGASKATSGEITEEKLAQYEEEYKAKLEEFHTATAEDYGKFSRYLGEITAYNEATANSEGVKTKDLREGSGRELTTGDTNYLAYYVGWCADETIFDSSLDSTTEPTAFDKALDASLGLIEGWNTGVVGMKLGGVRVITVPGELAYGESMEICGGYNKPLKFMIMAVAKEDPLMTLSAELDTAYMKYQYGLYGMDYGD